ncbi:V-set and transmembrane domain-containing protein 5 [Lissotriton helveticus]
MRSPGAWRKCTLPGVYFVLCFTELCLQSQGIALLIPQPVINATVAQNVLFSVDYSCKGKPAITWEYMSQRGIQNIIFWKDGFYVNVSKGYENRVSHHENGSIELLSVGIGDHGFYTVIVTEDAGAYKHATIVLNITETSSEDVYFTVISVAYLVAAMVLMGFLIRCLDNCVYLLRKRKGTLPANKLEEMELQTIVE